MSSSGVKIILTKVSTFDLRSVIGSDETNDEESVADKVNPSSCESNWSTIKLESVSIQNSIEKLFAADEPLFLTFTLIKTLSPLTGNLGLKEISATYKSNCLGVILFILPGVLNSISVDEPQFPD